jgi:16S rRNA (guanine527-N7)-methyltransferase
LFHVKLDPEDLLSGLDEGQVAQLRRFSELVAGRGADFGVISGADRERVWVRHVLDSLRVLACLLPEDESLADVGSGGGLPGVPLAIACPDLAFSLIEPRKGRVAFLELAVQELALKNARVLDARADEVSGRFSVCTARALAKPMDTWRLTSPLLAEGGRVVYFAGGSFTEADLAPLTALGVRSKICESEHFPTSGSLVIMQFGS